MKKKNWILTAVATIASILLLTLWYVLGFNHVDSPLDLVISIIWWIALGVSVYAITKAERKRREAMRTLFVGEGMMFNPERGLVYTGDEDMLDAAAELIDNLEYGFSTENMTGHIRPNIDSIIYTTKFDADDDVWEGEVKMVADMDSDPIQFKNRLELAMLMQNGFITSACSPVIPAYPIPAMA